MTIANINKIAKRECLFFRHYPNAYSFPVITCQEASMARNVSIERELKHMIIESNNHQQWLVHVPGSKKVSLFKVKHYLNKSDIKLANLSDYHNNSFHRGEICPFLAPFWEMTHLIDVDILKNKKMSTNDGSLRGFLIFNPKLLLFSQYHFIDSFS